VQDGRNEDGANATGQTRSLRLDVLIAVCALLISSLASAASWWQARLLNEQTRVLEEQLGAQVWPYVGTTEDFDNDTVRISVENNGLGPAIIRSETATVDGVRESAMIDVVHAVLGPHLTRRKPRGENLRLALNGGGPGSVLRAGESTALLTLKSKHFAEPLIRATSKRIRFQICYCAIIPGQCWFTDSATNADPRPVSVCHEIANDLLHASPADELNSDF
jgi:hypothetical protein